MNKKKYMIKLRKVEEFNLFSNFFLWKEFNKNFIIFILISMISLSLCMIVKDEELVLDRCLKSCYKLFDEIVIVDTGSTDKTKEIAKKYTDNIFDFKWCDDFSLARNFAIEKCTKKYFMWLDADDIIRESELKKLFNLKENLDKDTDIVMINYATSFDENNKPNFEYFRERIIKNNGKYKFSDPVHEAITPTGKIIFKYITIEHRKIKENKKNRNLKIYEKLKKKTPLTPRQQFYYSRELYYNKKIDKALKNFLKFIKQKNGFYENKIDACNILSKIYLEKNDFENAKQILFHSFVYDLPRAENLCNLGYIYQEEKDYEKSVYYFLLAKECEYKKFNLSFNKTEYYNFIPYIELCVGYYYLKDYQKSYYYNSLAKEIKPNDEIILKNEQILTKILEKTI